MSILEGTPKKEYKRWSKSTSVDGMEKTIRVEEIENGFLVSTEVYGNKDNDYKSDCKKYYSKTNPLGDMKPIKEEGVVDAINDFLKDM